MTKKVNKPSEEEIDQLVIAQAHNDSAWGKPIQVDNLRGSDVSLPAELASRAAFFARLHGEESLVGLTSRRPDRNGK